MLDDDPSQGTAWSASGPVSTNHAVAIHPPCRQTLCGGLRVEEARVRSRIDRSTADPIEDVSDDESRQQLETMVVAPMRLARLALPHMRVARDGRIVNVSSIYGLTTPDGVTGRSDQGTYVSACLCVLVTVSSLGYNS